MVQSRYKEKLTILLGTAGSGKNLLHHESMRLDSYPYSTCEEPDRCRGKMIPIAFTDKQGKYLVTSSQVQGGV